MTEQKPLKSDLILHWLIVTSMLCLLIVYNVVCHVMVADIQIPLEQQQRVFIRTIFYIIAIILFPLANLIRHIFIRLNETMPGKTTAKYRYLLTLIVSLVSIEIVGLFGFIMFILGDAFNTLYIFSLLALLGVFIHRPKLDEYHQIIEALRLQKLNAGS
ncbi:MAG: hypothetical protein HFP81_05490 [Methylococcales symbiont of Hymedesmia sp. n. MRB-2018]|nr:MAG: hypothetical protein HFP78_01530 [Methylococcales symbiont of Hymedesmia sp. n. MRB-2018]KAF3983764.1 MAG: hypothetical protein HFP81_05490 [Methylococcales symbiont of Hymedesmia sp. n. MRB-2018]